MRTYIVRRLLSGILILFFLSITVFVLLRVVGGAESIICGLNCTPEGLAQAREKLGLNDPYFPIDVKGGLPFVSFHAQSQYMTWLKDLSTGHLGVANFNQRPVIETMQHRLPVTLELLIITTLLTIVVGVPFGVISALYRNSIADYVVRVTAVLGLAVPSFWVGTLVLKVPTDAWGYAPPLGRSISFFNDPVGNLQQFGPPAAVLALASAAGIMRLTRSSLLEVMRTDYVRTARSKGLRETLVVSRHALKNSMIPVITVLGLTITGLLGGSVIIEQIFALPGLGKMIIEAILARQYQVVQSMTLYIGATVVLMNLLVDISYAWLDPRIRYS
jgi:peptide/nickel transport system permease protein